MASAMPPAAEAFAFHHARAQVLRQLRIGPGADAAHRVGRDIVGFPASHIGAAIRQFFIEAHGDVARRMAFLAVRQRLGQVGAAAQLAIGRIVILLQLAGLEVEQFPAGQDGALVERKRQRIGRRLLDDGWQAEQVSLDGQHIVARHLAERGIRKGRIQMFAMPADALVQCAHELVISPAADAGFLVGRDVRPVDGAERRGDRIAARKRLFLVHRMAGDAVGGGGQVLAAQYLVGGATGQGRNGRRRSSLLRMGGARQHQGHQQRRQLHAFPRSRSARRSASAARVSVQLTVPALGITALPAINRLS